jgi:hypothetical protein
MYIKKGICLFLLASLALFETLALGSLHITSAGSLIPAVNAADGTEPPPPPVPLPPTAGSVPTLVADGTEPPPPPRPLTPSVGVSV